MLFIRVCLYSTNWVPRANMVPSGKKPSADPHSTGAWNSEFGIVQLFRHSFRKQIVVCCRSDFLAPNQVFLASEFGRIWNLLGVTDDALHHTDWKSCFRFSLFLLLLNWQSRTEQTLASRSRKAIFFSSSSLDPHLTLPLGV